MSTTPVPPAAEPGYTTTEFVASVIGVVLVLVAPLGVHVTPDQQAELVTAIVAAYTLSRGLRKRGTPG